MATPAAPDLLHTHATASAAVVATRATVTVTITVDGPARARALGKLRTARARLNRTLTRFDATVTHTGTVCASVAQHAENWTAALTVAVDVGDVTALAALQAALSKIPAVAVTGTRFTLGADHPVWAAVRRDAVRSAAGQARTMADAADVTLGDLHTLTDSGTPRVTEPGGHGPVCLEAGLVTVQVDVHAAYRISGRK